MTPLFPHVRNRCVGAREVWPLVGEHKTLGKTPLGGSSSPKMSYGPTSTQSIVISPITDLDSCLFRVGSSMNPLHTSPKVFCTTL